MKPETLTLACDEIHVYDRGCTHRGWFLVNFTEETLQAAEAALARKHFVWVVTLSNSGETRSARPHKPKTVERVRNTLFIVTQEM